MCLMLSCTTQDTADGDARWRRESPAMHNLKINKQSISRILSVISHVEFMHKIHFEYVAI